MDLVVRNIQAGQMLVSPEGGRDGGDVIPLEQQGLEVLALGQFFRNTAECVVIQVEKEKIAEVTHFRRKRCE